MHAQEEEGGPASPWYATSTETDLESLLGSITEEGSERGGGTGSGANGGSPRSPAHPEDVEANGRRLSFSAFGSSAPGR